MQHHMAGALLENDPNRLPVRRPHTSGSQPIDQRRQELNSKADQIEATAQDANLPLRVTGGELLPGTIKFNIAFAPGINTPLNAQRIQALGSTFATSLGVEADAVKIDVQSGTIVVKRDDRQPIDLQKIVKRLPMRRIPFGSVVLGLADDGAPLLVRLPSPDVSHLLIAGSDEQATTDLLRTAATSLEMLHHKREIQILPIDGHQRHGLDALRQQPEYLMHDIVTDPSDMETQLRSIVDLKNRRSAEKTSLPHIAVVINGLSNIEHASPKTKQLIDDLLSTGRESGIHIVADTNEPIENPHQFPVIALGQTRSSEEALKFTNLTTESRQRLNRDEFIASHSAGFTKFYPAHVIKE